MFAKLFGTNKEEAPKQPPEPAVKNINQMNSQDIKEYQRKYKRDLQKQIRDMDKQITNVERERTRAENDLKKEVQKGVAGDKFKKQMYARQVLQCNKLKQNQLINKGKIQGCQYALDQYFASVKIGQVVGQSAEILKALNQSMNIKEIQKEMGEMGRELEKMGIINEMVQDAMDIDDSSLDNDADIDKVIFDAENAIANKNPQLNQQNINMMGNAN